MKTKLLKKIRNRFEIKIDKCVNDVHKYQIYDKHRNNVFKSITYNDMFDEICDRLGYHYHMYYFRWEENKQNKIAVRKFKNM